MIGEDPRLPLDPKMLVVRLTDLLRQILRAINDLYAKGSGVKDHGELVGLGDDDHPQYLTAVRADARYASIEDVGGAFAPDPSPPPTPSGVTLSAGFTSVTIKTDAPTFTVGHGYGRTVVYGKKWPLDVVAAPTFSDAAVVAEFVGQVGSLDSEPATRWCLWLKWMSRDGAQSVTPSGGTNGHQITTGQDVAKVLEALSNQLGVAQLRSDLNTRIDLIDAPAGTPNSVRNLVAAEASSRDSAISAAVAVEASARATQTGELFAKYGVKLDVNGYVTGWSMNNDGVTGSMVIHADNFAIGKPGTGVANIYPFIVRTTSTVENGVSIPAGVYMDSAYVVNLSAMYSRMGNLVADQIATSSFDAAQITAGTLNAGRIGVRTLTGDKIVAGSITANEIDSRGLSIKDASGNVILAAGTALPLAYAAAGTKNSDLLPAIATAGGTNLFSGTLPAYQGANLGASLVDAAYTGPSGQPTAVQVNIPQSGAYLTWNLSGLQPGFYTVKVKIQVTSGQNIIVATTDGTSWATAQYTGVNSPTTAWVQVTLRQQVVSAGLLAFLVGAAYNTAGSVVAATTPANTTFGVSDLWVEREAYTGALDATKGATFGVDIGGQITAGNASTYIANAAIGSAQIGQVLAGNIAVTELSKVVSGGVVTGGRVEVQANKILVYDPTNAIRVKIGYLL